MLYPETMEEARKGESHSTGYTGMAGVGREQLPESLPAHGWERPCTAGNLERKTRTGRILQHPLPVRVCALMRLNRRVPNGTHGGVRGRGFSVPPTRFASKGSGRLRRVNLTRPGSRPSKRRELPTAGIAAPPPEPSDPWSPRKSWPRQYRWRAQWN